LRRVVLALLGGAIVVALLAVVAAVSLAPRAEGWLRVKAVEVLEARLASDVELGSLEVTPGPVTRIAGGPLAIRHREHRDIAPLIHIDRFETTVSWRALLHAPRRIDEIRLEGLAIAIPPSTATPEERAEKAAEARAREPVYRTESPAPSAVRGEPAVVIDRVTADDATVVVLPRDKKKLPRRFVLHALTVRDISTDRPMAFDAIVENPKPRGNIATTGTFGPWQVDIPARTPLDATFRFTDADLSTIRGIGGRLQAEGRYGGVIERIEAVGTSLTPQFDLDVGGRTLPVDARFTVVVDGTNGNTYLQPAEAVLGAKTPVRVTGGIVKAEDRRGRTVDLAMQILDGRLEEILSLVVDGKPAMRGRVKVDGSLLIPPGPEKVMQRMVLAGRFTLANATFTSTALQAKLDELSRRAQGRPNDAEIARVVSAFSGRFRMADGMIRFPALSFRVDGARVQLAGSYAFEGQRLDFAGRVRLEAGVSRMIDGKKALLLRPLDGLFRHDGATEFPIHIKGTARHPEFGVDVKAAIRRAFKRGA